MVVLDTDHLSLLERRNSPEWRRWQTRLQQVPPRERVATIVSYEEQTRGWLAYPAKSRTPAQLVDGFRRRKVQLENYCGLIILPFDELAAAKYEYLQLAKVRVKPKDMQIAAIVLANDALLLTRNLRDFGRIAGLKVEDWTVDAPASR